MSDTPEGLRAAIDRLRRMRHARAMTAPGPAADGSLVPLLNASAECCALDVAVRVLEERLREVAS